VAEEAVTQQAVVEQVVFAVQLVQLAEEEALSLLYP